MSPKKDLDIFLTQAIIDRAARMKIISGEMPVVGPHINFNDVDKTIVGDALAHIREMRKTIKVVSRSDQTELFGTFSRIVRNKASEAYPKK